MIVRIINVYVKPDAVEAFRKATLTNRDGSIREPGVLRFDLLQDATDESKFVLYEVYRSDEATAAHKETDHYREWKSAVEPLMARGRERYDLRAVAPLDEGEWRTSPLSLT